METKTETKTETKDYAATCPSMLPPLSVNGMAEFYANKLSEPLAKVPIDPEIPGRFAKLAKLRIGLTVLCSVGAFFAFKEMYVVLQNSSYAENDYILALAFSALQIGVILNTIQLGVFIEGKDSESMALQAAKALALGDHLFSEVYRLWNTLAEKEQKIGNLTVLLEAEQQKNAELKAKLRDTEQEPAND